MHHLLTISQAAQATGLSAHTLRYYEQIGLLASVGRSSGARRYTEDDMRWLAFLLRLRSTGMATRDMLRYAQWRRLGDTAESLAQRQALLERHVQVLQAQQRVLADTVALLHDKVHTYQALRGLTPAAEDR